MTENTSEFTQEPVVGSSAGDSTIVEEHPSEDSVAKLNLTYSNPINFENENRNTVTMSEECDSRLSNSGCEHELPSLQDHWLKLSTFFRRVYHSILDGEKPPNEYESHVTIVRELVASDPHQLFARLEMDLQEFIIEVKLRQLELLNCVHTHEGPQLFIFCLIESYNKLMFAASTLSPLLSQLEKEHLAKFDISWRGLNQHLFHKLVFTDPKIQKVIPLCISKLGKMNSKLSDFNKKLIRQFLNFDGEMIRIGAKWREAESSIIKYHQENSMLDAKERMMKVNWELIKTQSKVFHEELKSSGISSDVGSDILSNGHIMNSSSEGSTENIFNDENDKKSVEIKPAQIQTTLGAVETINSDTNEQEVCESCHLDASRCLGSSVPVNFESNKESKIVDNTDDLNEIFDEDLEILTHLNAEGRKMYSHLHKFKAQQILNGGENVCTESMEFSATDAPVEPPSASQDTLPSAPPPSVPATDVQKTAVRKQVIQQQQQQKKIMQMIQTSPQKDIHQKLQKQLQEQQILMQQQRKIEELQNHILQQHPLHMDKEMQKKMHLQMQQCLMQKHKQMEEKFHQQVQQHMQQHQEKPSTPAPSTKSIKTAKDSCCQNFNHKCSTSVTATTSSSYLATKSNGNPVTPSAVRAPPSKTVTTNVSTATTNVTHKNSTTQTPTTPIDGQNRAHHHPLPDVVKSASYVCPKHSDGTNPNAHNHIDHDNCSDNSSDEDYSSERSSSPQRHCDCCYCEVFGSAPVRRNYQETRERLRSILNKKKAKSNATATATDGKVSSADPAASSTGSVSRATSQGGKPKKDDAIQDKSNPLEYKGDKSIEEILDFIEGNKNRNVKRTAKKMRRKQRQLEEEERRRKEEEEAERLRLEELRRQEEAERRRQEEERRRQEQLLREQSRKKNKKKGAKSTTNQSNAKLSQAASTTQAGKKLRNQTNATNERLKPTLQNQKTTREQTCQKAAAAQPSPKPSYATQKKQASAARPEVAKPQSVQKQQPGKQKVAEKPKQAQPVKKNTQKKETAPSSTPKSGSDAKAPAQPQMVTIKRVMQPNSSEPTVTITLRGPTPKDDKVLYTLLNGQMCSVKDEKNKKQASTSSSNSNASNAKKSKPANNNVRPTVNMHAAPPPQMMPPRNVVNFNKSCSLVGNGVSSITERMERLKLGPLPVTHEQPKRLNVPSTSPAELTTPTAIQINQAVNQLSARPTFPNNFDLENIKLPPGITITKVDPATVQRKPIQVKQQPAPRPVPQTHIRQNMMPSVPGSSNVIVVDTVDKNNYYQSAEQAAAAGKKKRRKRGRKNQEMMAGEAPPVSTMAYGAHNGGLPPRMGPFGAGMFGSPFMNAAGYGNMAAAPPQQPAAIIQMNGSMVTIRNPAVHRAYGGPPMDYQDAGKMKMQNFDDTMLSSPPAEMENGDVDDYERELEAFKQFCSQSVPAESKAKVNLNIEDIVLKKKGPVIGCS